MARIEPALRRGLEDARELPGVRDVRLLGAIGTVDLENPVDVAVVNAAAIEHGVWLPPSSSLIYAMPGYVMGDEDLATLTAAMVGAARAST